jgi:Abnormal spindle-like microcephaly-assoc'd, ASPM-SPD-2-Hydin
MHGRLFVGFTILTTAILLGCGGGNSSSAGSSATTTHAVAAGNLGVFPATLNFGKVTVGTKKGLTATLTAGNSRIIVRSADWGGPGFSIAGIVFPLTVPAGQSVNFKVTFAPKTAGQVSGNVKFVSNADNSPKAIFNGNGTATPAHRVTLAWRAPATAVAGYNVYRGVAAQGPFTRLTSSPHLQATFTDASVVGGSTYFYATTAVNKKGKESKHSNHVKVTIPNS